MVGGGPPPSHLRRQPSARRPLFLRLAQAAAKEDLLGRPAAHWPRLLWPVRAAAAAAAVSKGAGGKSLVAAPSPSRRSELSVASQGASDAVATAAGSGSKLGSGGGGLLGSLNVLQSCPGAGRGGWWEREGK